MKLLFIIGMQKAGTSLLNRMLMAQGFINNPFLPEGKFFWGDVPPFSPVQSPCGVLFQKHEGKQGHYLDQNDFLASDQQLLLQRIKKASISEPVLMSKNPYNSVRVKWIKEMFPKSYIIAIYRNPVANIYSLLKKYVENKEQKVKPENGWWGIKPKNWQEILCKNKLEQCSKQWVAVNQEILNCKNDVDIFISYENLCKNPNKLLLEVSSLCNVDTKLIGFSSFKCLNNEHLKGSQLQSKNQEFRKRNSLDLFDLKEAIEFPAFSLDEINQVTGYCESTWSEFF